MNDSVAIKLLERMGTYLAIAHGIDATTVGGTKMTREIVGERRVADPFDFVRRTEVGVAEFLTRHLSLDSLPINFVLHNVDTAMEQPLLEVVEEDEHAILPLIPRNKRTPTCY
jgi:hypothetical protein